jgi:hypothetical protein
MDKYLDPDTKKVGVSFTIAEDIDRCVRLLAMTKGLSVARAYRALVQAGLDVVAEGSTDDEWSA